MRRTDREISDIDEILNIIKSCKICRIGLIGGDTAYIVPLNFGYLFNDGALELYFHSATQGEKITLMQKNPKVCFEMDCGHRLVTGETACSYGYLYESVIGRGYVTFIEDPGEKCKAMSHLMEHQTGISFDFSEKDVQSLAVYKIIADSITGKARRMAPPVL